MRLPSPWVFHDHASGTADQQTPPPATKEQSKGDTLRLGLKPVVGVAVAAFLVYHILTLAYVVNQLTASTRGPFGLTMAVNDAMSEQYPLHNNLLQKMVLNPLPNPGALRYYNSQREFFLQAASEFQLHPYWSNHNGATPEMTFRECITERIHSMYRQFNESNGVDDSYRLEKDRCAQFEFLRRNNIPHPRVRKTWYSREQVLEDVTTEAAVEGRTTWPVFFKACHLTQRSSLGTFAMSSSAAFKDKKQDLLDWIEAKWDYRSHDVDRPWQADGDALTDELTPAIILQDPMMETTTTPAQSPANHAPPSSPSSTSASTSSSYALEGRIAVGLVEIKAEVLWGKVYLMQLDGTAVFLRNGVFEDHGTFMGGVLHRPGQSSDPRTDWIRDEGYLDCVVEIAERVAQAAHIEYIRVDVFLDRGDPANCAINEVSLSSGYSYYGHEPYMAKLWAEPLQSGLYQRFNSTTPVYELISS